MKGILLMAYGTPQTLNDVEAYFTHIRGGRKPAPAEVENLVERYKAIGGTSPLVKITERQRAGLQRKLARSGSSTRVYTAMKHSPPFISDLVRRASGEVDELLALALAPHYSEISVGSYIRSAEEANASLSHRLKLDFVRSWHTNPLLIKAWADRVRRAERDLPPGYALVFSAHSLPERILTEGDPYREQLLETSRLVAADLGRGDWTFCFQSASHTSEPWMGPDIIDHLAKLHADGKRNFLVAQIGFVSDHLEVLYDLDVEAREWADRHGAKLVRCPSLNESKELIDCLYSIAVSKGFL